MITIFPEGTHIIILMPLTGKRPSLFAHHLSIIQSR